MRTTLKRGIGRGAAVNGNGSRPVLPPATPTPITRYRQPGPARSRGGAFLRAALLWLLVAAVMVVVALAAGLYLFEDRQVTRLTANAPAEVVEAQEKLDVPTANAPANALVIGYDKRVHGPEAGLEGRSDTVMLLRADPRRNTVSMLSFPRDLWVDIYCPNGTSTGSLNSAYTLCGPKGVVETIKRLTGVQINYLITVNFRGFRQLVSRLGGVWIDVDRRYFNDNSGYEADYATIDLRPGYQKLNGQQALDFVRYRHTDSDIYRQARQQMFVRALREQVAASFDPLTALRLVGAVTGNVHIVTGGDKKVSKQTIRSYAGFAYGLPSGNFFQTKIEGLTEIVQGQAPLTTDPGNIRAAVDEFLNPDVAAPVKATAVALGQPLRRTAPPPRSTPITVLNGNGRTGAASTAGALLSRFGYPIVPPPGQAPANAPTMNYFPTKVYFRPTVPASRPAATKVAELFGNADIEPIPGGKIAQLGRDAMLTVVVGETFQGTLAPAPVDKTPERTPPSVRRDPEQARGYIREAARRVSFPLQLPTVLEKTSLPDYYGNGQPLHVYRYAGGRKTVRLTFRTGATEYWGIQMTNWKDAPALRDPSARRKLGGRWFDLYYSGAKLRMVVLRDRGVTYWVVNTLLNTLSNETMLAIAKGLQPYRE